MLDELVIVNFSRDCELAMPTGFTNLQWQTCLRRIVFLHCTELSLLQPLPSRSVVHREQEAYQFLLEVICGLHSSLLGETAVMGQFRNFRANATLPATAWGDFLRQLLADLLVDARYIRRAHLEGLGCQSYGSLVRKHLRSIDSIALLGTGSLAQEILPWLTSDASIRVFYRSTSHARRISGPNLRCDQFSMADAGWEGDAGALIVAAPLSSGEIIKWLELQSTKFSLIMDLRGEAVSDPVSVSQRLLKLSELFESLSYQRKRLEHVKLIALRDIELLAGRRYPTAQLCCA